MSAFALEVQRGKMSNISSTSSVCQPCDCPGVEKDAYFVRLTTSCAVASFLGVFGSLYTVLSIVGTIFRLQAKLRHRLWNYLLNGGFLIALLAVGEGILGATVFKSTLNSALYGPYWGDLQNLTTECQLTGRLQQFAAWLEYVVPVVSLQRTCSHIHTRMHCHTYTHARTHTHTLSHQQPHPPRSSLSDASARRCCSRFELK